MYMLLQQCQCCCSVEFGERSTASLQCDCLYTMGVCLSVVSSAFQEICCAVSSVCQEDISHGEGALWSQACYKCTNCCCFWGAIQYSSLKYKSMQHATHSGMIDLLRASLQDLEDKTLLHLLQAATFSALNNTRARPSFCCFPCFTLLQEAWRGNIPSLRA